MSLWAIVRFLLVAYSTDEFHLGFLLPGGTVLRMDVSHQVPLTHSMEVDLHAESVVELAGEILSTVLELLFQLVPSGFAVCRAHGLLGRCFRVIELLQQLGVGNRTLVAEQPNGKSFTWGMGLEIGVLDLQ